jgi:hypothetical protein
MMVTAVHNTTMIVSVLTIYIWWVLLFLKQHCNRQYVLYIDILGRSVFETAVQPSVCMYIDMVGSAVGETAVKLWEHTVYRYVVYSCE